MPEYHEVIGAGDLYEINTQKNSDYDTAMYLDVSNIDKNDNNTRRNIYKAIGKGYFVKEEHLSIYVKTIQMSHKKFQLISRKIFKNSIGRNFMCAGGEDSP